MCVSCMKVFNSVEIKPEMTGHYLAEFSCSYKPVKHGRPGVRALLSVAFALCLTRAYRLVQHTVSPTLHPVSPSQTTNLAVPACSSISFVRPSLFLVFSSSISSYTHSIPLK